MLLVFGLAHGDGSWTQTRLLLTGVIVAAGCGALVALMLSIAPEHKLRGMLFWLMGDLSQTGAPCPARRACRGAAGRHALRPRTQPAGAWRRHWRRRWASTSAPALRASTARLAGDRRCGHQAGSDRLHRPDRAAPGAPGGGNDQRLLLPASVLAGGSLLVMADTLARTMIAPQQLPVGVLTALIGVPVFLFLLCGSQGAGRDDPYARSALAAQLCRRHRRNPCATPLTSACGPANATGHPRPQRRRQVDAAVGARRSARRPTGDGTTRRRHLRRTRPTRGALRGLAAQRHSRRLCLDVLETALTGRHPHLGRWDWEGKRDAKSRVAHWQGRRPRRARSSATCRRFPAASASAWPSPRC
jgi:hypothetical protein